MSRQGRGVRGSDSMNPIDLADRLRIREFREVVVRAGYVVGAGTDTGVLASSLADCGYYLTPDLAREAIVQGWNIRCNRCGTYGATWHALQRRNAQALCPAHSKELADETARHANALAELLRVNFEQETTPLHPNLTREGRR